MTDFSQRIAALSPEKRELLLRRWKTREPQDILSQGREQEWGQTPPLRAYDRLEAGPNLTTQFPLSFAQQRLWFLDQLEPGSTAYLLSWVYQLYGRLDTQCFEKSLHELVRRHESLRTTFAVGTVQTCGAVACVPCATAGYSTTGLHTGYGADPQPVQVIHPTGGRGQGYPLLMIDLQRLSQEEGVTQYRQLATQEAQHPCDLKNGPLLRFRLLRLTSEEHILFLTMHHIISDGWSMEILMRELSELYKSFIERRPSTLSALPIQYADFTLWQRQWFQGEVLQKQLDYWKQQLAGAPPVLNLPTDRPRPAVQTSEGAKQSLLLSSDLLERLKTLSQQENVTLFMTLLAAFQVLLARYSGQQDVIVGTPIANRTQRDLESLIGFFVNTLVLRSDLSDNPSFRQLLSRVREVALQAYMHQDLPFEKLVESLQVERALSHSPIFQVLFTVQNGPPPDVELAGITFHQLEKEHFTALFDLSLVVLPSERGLLTTLEYSTDLFDATTIERLLGHWQVLLEAFVRNPEQPIGTLPLLTSQEREQLLVQWNTAARDFSSDQCLHQLIEQQVEQTPDAIAVVFEETLLTYRELNCQANYLAHRLLGEGVGPDVLVGVCMERSLELVVALLAILKAGGAYVPLDPQLPQERLTFMLEDAQVSVVLTQTLQDKLDGHSDGLSSTTIKVICLPSDSSRSYLEHADNPKSGVQPENLAYMIYTSGSTGKPKGAMNTHRGICNRLLWMQEAYQLTPRDRVLQKTSPSFDVSVWEFFWPLLTGASLIVARPGGHQDPTYLAMLIAEQQVTTLHFVPSMLQAFLGSWSAGHETNSKSTGCKTNLKNCTSLRQVLCSGEVLTPALQARFFASVAEEVKLHNLYGPTEAAIDVTSWKCRREDDKAKVLIGHPIANTQIYLLDSDLEPVPIGIPGELYIGGVSLARGYFKRPDLTAERFIANPFVGTGSAVACGLAPQVRTIPTAPVRGGERLYRTGDLARYRHDGAIEFLGRLDDQVKLHGFRIELGEVEAALRTHPAVQEAVVVLHEEATIGQYLAAYVVGQRTEQPTQKELQSHLRRQLPDYMVPATFVPLETLPLTPNGKVNRKALPVPTRIAQSSEGYVAPQSELEQRLSQIWQGVLKLAQVGIYENFFDLGGHSLLLIQVQSKLQAYLGYEVPVVDLFQHPTIHVLSAHLSAQQEQQPTFPVITERVRKRKEALQQPQPTRGRIKR